MIARKIQNSKLDRCRDRILNFGLNFKMVDHKFQNSNFDRCRGRILKFGINLKMVARKTQNSAAVELLIWILV